jgi:hypothetical protein
MSGEIHVSRVGTYHPNPQSEASQGVAWTINDTRGYLDGGPSCDGPDCSNPCDCEACEDHNTFLCDECNAESECIGLSFAFVCLDGGESLCPDCAALENITIVPCDCEEAHT